jgi:hypothetical protein
MRFGLKSQNDINPSSVFVSPGLAPALKLQALPADWLAALAHAAGYIFFKA